MTPQVSQPAGVYQDSSQGEPYGRATPHSNLHGVTLHLMIPRVRKEKNHHRSGDLLRRPSGAGEVESDAPTRVNARHYGRSGAEELGQHRDEITTQRHTELMNVQRNMSLREGSTSHLHVPTNRLQLLPPAAELNALH